MVIDGTGSSELIFNDTVLSAWQKVTLETCFFSSVKQDPKLNLGFVHIQGLVKNYFSAFEMSVGGKCYRLE